MRVGDMHNFIVYEARREMEFHSKPKILSFDTIGRVELKYHYSASIEADHHISRLPSDINTKSSRLTKSPPLLVILKLPTTNQFPFPILYLSNVPCSKTR